MTSLVHLRLSIPGVLGGLGSGNRDHKPKRTADKERKPQDTSQMRGGQWLCMGCVNATSARRATIRNQTIVSWVWAIALLLILHASWMGVTAWRLHRAERWVLFGCEDDGEPDGGGLPYFTTEP